jgi:hypothetical protein
VLLGRSVILFVLFRVTAREYLSPNTQIVVWLWNLISFSFSRMKIHVNLQGSCYGFSLRTVTLVIGILSLV